MKGLKFKQGDFNFIVDVKDVLHIADIKDVQNDLKEINTINFKDLLHTGETPLFVIFVGKGKKLKGILVEKIIEVCEIGEVFPFEKNIFVIEFIKGMVKIDEEIYYLIDFDKIIEVDYEEESPSN